jgi:hypothetical protein
LLGRVRRSYCVHLDLALRILEDGEADSVPLESLTWAFRVGATQGLTCSPEDALAERLIEMTVEDCQRAFAEGSVTAEALAEAFLARIETYNPRYKCSADRPCPSCP